MDHEKRLIQMLAEDIMSTPLRVWPFIVTQDHHGHQDFRASPNATHSAITVAGRFASLEILRGAGDATR